MHTFKSIERPAQVLGISIQGLGLVFGILIGGGMLTGSLGIFINIPAVVYLLLLLSAAAVFFGLKYVNKHHPPGFLAGYLSFLLRQPKRLTLGPSNVLLHKQLRKRSTAK
jgi:hypothetical protein